MFYNPKPTFPITHHSYFCIIYTPEMESWVTLVVRNCFSLDLKPGYILCISVFYPILYAIFSFFPFPFSIFTFKSLFLFSASAAVILNPPPPHHPSILHKIYLPTRSWMCCQTYVPTWRCWTSGAATGIVLCHC